MEKAWGFKCEKFNREQAEKRQDVLNLTLLRVSKEYTEADLLTGEEIICLRCLSIW